MQAKIELVFPNRTQIETVDLRCKPTTRGVRLLNAVDNAVHRQFKATPGWTRWNLREFIGLSP